MWLFKLEKGKDENVSFFHVFLFEAPESKRKPCQVFAHHDCCCLQGKREAVIAVYEAKPLISDHKIPGADFMSCQDVS